MVSVRFAKVWRDWFGSIAAFRLFLKLTSATSQITHEILVSRIFFSIEGLPEFDSDLRVKNPRPQKRRAYYSRPLF